MKFWRFTSEILTTAKQTKQGWLKTDPSLLTAISFPSMFACVSTPAWIHTFICVNCVFLKFVFFHIRGFCRNPGFDENKESLKDTCQFLPDDVGRCVLRPPCKQVIKSRRRPGQALPRLWVHSLPSVRSTDTASALISPHTSLLICAFPAYFTSFVSFPCFVLPSAAPRARSLRKSRSLIWDMLDLMSLKAI